MGPALGRAGGRWGPVGPCLWDSKGSVRGGRAGGQGEDGARAGATWVGTLQLVVPRWESTEQSGHPGREVAAGSRAPGLEGGDGCPPRAGAPREQGVCSLELVWTGSLSAARRHQVALLSRAFLQPLGRGPA